MHQIQCINKHTASRLFALAVTLQIKGSHINLHLETKYNDISRKTKPIPIVLVRKQQFDIG